MNRIIYLSLLLLTMGLLFSSCEKDDMNEDELLKKIQETDLNLSVVESSRGRSVGGAQVRLTNNGEVLTAETDSSGIAVFSDVSVGEAKLHITKEGYFEYHKQITIETNGREASAGYIAEVYSKDEVARIVGNVKIQTDLTTDSAEHPEGITITAFNTDDNPLATAKTDADGDFDLLVPTDASGRSIWVKFPELEYDQKIAVRLNDTTVVGKTAVGTIFKPYAEAEEVESTSNIKIDIPPTDNTWNEQYLKQAYIESIEVDTVNGIIQDIKIGYPGRGYETGVWYYMTITSTVGTGAQARVKSITSDNTPYYLPLEPNNVDISDNGSGYTTFKPNQNVYTQSPIGFIWDDNTWYYNARLTNTNWVEAGEIYRINANYGTGTDIGDIQ